MTISQGGGLNFAPSQGFSVNTLFLFISKSAKMSRLKPNKRCHCVPLSSESLQSF